MSVMGDKGQHPQAWPYNMYGAYNPNAPPQNWQFSAYTEAMPQNFQYMNYGYHGQMAYPSMQNGQVYKPMMQGPIKQFTPGGQLQSFGQEKKEKQQEEEKDKQGQDLPPLPPGPPPSNPVSQPSPPGITPFYQQNSGAGPLRFNMNRPQRPQFNQGGLFNNSGASKKKRKKKNKFNQQQQTQGQMFGPATSNQMIRPPLPPQMKAPPLPPGPPPASPKPPPDDIVIPPEPKASSSLEFDYKGEADWPGDLKKYISECYTKCKTSVDKDRVSIILKGKILRATNDGTLWDKNWATEPFPLLQAELETLSVQPVYKPPAEMCQPQFKKRPSATLSSRLGQRQISRSKSASRSRSRSPPKSRQRSPIRNRRRRDRSDSSESENNWTPPPTSKKAKGRNLNLDKRGGKGKKGKGDTERSVSTSECCSSDHVNYMVSDDIDTQSSNVSIEVVITQPYRYYIQEDKKTPVSDFCNNSRGHFYSEFGQVSGEVPVNSELLEKRAARFNSSRRSKANKNGYMNTTVTFSNTSLLGVMEDTNGDFELGDCHVVGVCQDIEKPYLRLTAAPEAASVRPPDVLRQALSRVKDRWVQKQDYHYACEQLKSIRQDLTVQGIRDQLTVAVYETHARIALEKGDHAEFNQCQSQLKLLFDETPTENMREFTAYRILYFIFTKEDMDLHTVMRTLSEADRKDECVSHALSVRSAWALSNYHKLFKLYRQAPRMSSCLMDWFLPRERKLALKSIIKAYRQTLPVSFVTEELAFQSDCLCREFLSQFGVVYADGERTKIDCKTSSTAVTSA